MSRETEVLSKQLGRSPKPREVAHALGCSVEEVLEAQQAAASYEAARLGCSQMHVSRVLRRALRSMEDAAVVA